MKRHHFIAILTTLCGLILAIHYRAHTHQASIIFILCSLVAVSIFFKDRHRWLSRRVVSTRVLIGICVFTLGSGIFLLYHEDVKNRSKQNVLEPQSAGASENKSDSPQNIGPTPEETQAPLTRKQKILDSMASEDFTRQVKESIDSGTEPEALTSFSNFLKYLDSQGFAGVKNFDAQSYYPRLFEKHFPGKKPSDLDSEMKQQLLSLIEELGYEKGTLTFSKDPKSALWLAARFNLLADDGQSVGTWKEQILADSFGESAASETFQIPSEAADLHRHIPEKGAKIQNESDTANDRHLQFDVSVESIPADSLNQVSRDERSTKGDPTALEKWMSDTSEVPTREAFENHLRERFSPQRLNIAMQILNQYGPEKGLRRLKSSDPEVADHLEKFLETYKDQD